ncbi:MAG: DUF445 family protein [Ruminococcus sp.]|nr:DUF445 family protein [Ruminococcus sp.]
MEAFKIIMSLLISAVIGYCTNYIAVKMLFRPRTEKHIFGKRIPFTPGIIPKNKPRLARALGAAVGEQLLTGDDLRTAFASEKTAGAAADKLTEALFSEKPLGESVKGILGEENAQTARDRAQSMIVEMACEKIREADISGLIVREGSAAVKEKVAGSMLAMFVNDDLIASLASPLAAKIEGYLANSAPEAISKAVGEEIDRVSERSPAQLLTDAGVNREAVRNAAVGLIIKAAESSLDSILASVDIPKMVEERVNAMSVEQVEELVMSVMKHELNAVISLGALIGLIIGVLNVIVQRI